MNFLETMKEIARSNKKTIVLPESNDIRVLKAAEEIIKQDLASVILIGKEEEVRKMDTSLSLDKIIFVDPENHSEKEKYIQSFYELRKNKGITLEKAEEILKHPLYYGVMMVKLNDAHGLVAGAAHSTADVLRPSLQILKTAPGISTVSACFVMVLEDKSFGDNGVLVFGDCALNQNPNAEELAAIAKSCGDSFKALVKSEPKIALLSHSTFGSASHNDVDKVAKAVQIAKEKYPDLNIDGELQLDAAVVASVAKQKAPDSSVAGSANVLVFPTLDAGNIGYKLVQRFAGAEAYGPITQGIAKPVNDLSRGCSVDDIIGVVAITSVQAQMQ